jgi:DNA-binding CsgD family transcriptional regulator
MRQGDLTAIPEPIRWYAEQLMEARGDALRLGRVIASSPLPMVIVDGQRRYLELNSAARSSLGASEAELEGLRVDDLTPPYRIPALEANWEHLMMTGWVASPARTDPTARGYLGVTYYALANALPGRHVIAFTPPGWPDARAPGTGDSMLTPRQLEILVLAADGRDGPEIAHTLMLSPATVRTHFQNIYAALGVRDRAGAVAQAFRRGLIA